MALFMLPKKLGVRVSTRSRSGKRMQEVWLECIGSYEGDLEGQLNLLRDISRSKYDICE